MTFAEVLATSDVPGGVVNILTGSAATARPWLASHMDVNAIDLTGLAGDAEQATALEVAAADEPQAGTPRAGRRARLERGPGPRPDDGVPGDQDRLAPDRRLTRTARSVTAWTSPAPAGR